jgi:hypothetical protein
MKFSTKVGTGAKCSCEVAFVLNSVGELCRGMRRGSSTKLSEEVGDEVWEWGDKVGVMKFSAKEGGVAKCSCASAFVVNSVGELCRGMRRGSSTRFPTKLPTKGFWCLRSLHAAPHPAPFPQGGIGSTLSPARRGRGGDKGWCGSWCFGSGDMPVPSSLRRELRRERCRGMRWGSSTTLTGGVFDKVWDGSDKGGRLSFRQGLERCEA